jgi:hypothetical protein
VTASITEVNLDTISVQIDSVEVATSLPFSWDTTGYSDGSHTVLVVVTDKVGNEGSDSVTVTVDNTDPNILNVIVTTSTPIDTIIGWENFTCTVTDGLSGVDEVYIYIQSVQYLMQQTGSTSTYYYNWTLNYGNRTYYIKAFDNAGNSKQSDPTIISIPPNWDVIVDGVCNINDVVQISNTWLQVGTPGWIRADINNDGVVNILDVSAISVHWLEVWWI